jgi:hypothetical protein
MTKARIETFDSSSSELLDRRTKLSVFRVSWQELDEALSTVTVTKGRRIRG